MEKLKVRIEESVDSASALENISYYILMATAFLLPIFFVPSLSFPFQFSKSVFVSVAVLLAFAVWLIARLKDGRYIFPNSVIYFGAALVIVVSFISAILSPAAQVSLIGQGFEVGTWANLVVLFLVMFLFSALFRPKERVFYLYLALFLSFGLIILFHVLRFIFGAGFLSFGLFTNITSNLIGKWNDLGIFFALVAMVATMTLDLLSLSRTFRTLIWTVLVLSVLSLTVVNFQTVWYVLAAFSLLFYVYAFAYKRQFSDGSAEGEFAEVPPKKRGSLIAIVILVVSLVFLADSYLPSRPLSTKIAAQFNVSNLEVRPNWSSTLSVAKSSVKTDPIFGVGLNRFTNQWLSNKPAGINDSIFWNTDFNFGIGLLPTFIVTTGLLGFISWLFFILVFLYVGLKKLLTPVEDRLSRYLSASSFFASSFLWVFFIFYIPSTAVLTLTFLFTGIFLASLYNERLLKPKTITFIEEPKLSFISVLVLTVFLVGALSLGFIFSKKFFAAELFQKAVIASNAGNIADAESYAKRAVNLSGYDLYDRFLVEVDLAKLSNLLSSTASNATADSVRSQFQDIMGDALARARAATAFDETNYQNWVSLGRVYEAVVPLKIDGAFDSAKAAYDRALALNPQGPQIHLILARLSSVNGDNKTAETEIEAARALKTNYTEAIFLLSQIQVSEGKIRDAISSAESAAALAPNDPTVFFQVGLLKYNNRDYSGAVQALERAVGLSPSYSNAKYFLGLSYYKLGRTSDAIVQLNDIHTLNPDNTEVPQMIANIKAGRDPFANEVPPAPAPEKRDTLPVEENSVQQ